jgi:hypothetical protein
MTIPTCPKCNTKTAINGEIFFHFVVPEDDGSVEYYAE